MPVTCPRCLRSLSTADPSGPPVFCMYCGQKLRDPAETHVPADRSGPDGMRTSSFVPFSADPEEDDEPAPAAVGGYRLLRLIGSGGMGTVYEAEAPGTAARVAVKLLSSRLASSPSSVERFRQEGRLASQLTHPRCVFVLAADTDAGRPYIVMELMPGRTLKDLVDQTGPLTPAEAIAYTLDAIDGLAEAHRLGVLHRDVKPSNCFLTADGRVKLGDFGLSKSLAGSRDRQLTQSGAFLGTVLFASPEQIRGEPLDYGADVYSLCATLYYLLCGEAPYHHESVTAALARAISEPPPSICAKCPAVPRALEKVLMRGLERDRDRRWQSLDDLRDALVNLLPGRQTPARPRALVGAYLFDWLVLGLFAVVPLEILHSTLQWEHVAVGGVVFDPVGWALGLSYFATLEGLFGRTAGKALLGLRVSRVGTTGPPGLARGWVRAGAFTALWAWLLYAPAVIGHYTGGVVGGLVALAVGLVVLLVQVRRSGGGYRGVHDFLSGCHVTQRPFPARKLRLVSRRPNPLDAELAADPKHPLPSTVGGFAVRSRVWAGAAGEQVWAAEDRVLGRRVLLWVRPGGDPATAEVARPTRLRRLGHGSLRWAGREFGWTAFAAPIGAPLADTIRPKRPLPWADARFLLEQLVDEFRAAEADGSLPARLGLDQVWVDPNGRVQVIDFPTADDRGSPADPFAVLREVAALALEGRPREAVIGAGGTGVPPVGWLGDRRDAGPTEHGVNAPVPPHAAPILSRLVSPGGYGSLAELHHDLTATHAYPPEVTPSLRAAQLGIQAALLFGGLALMFTASGVAAMVLAELAGIRAEQAEHALAVLRDPAQRAELARTPETATALDNEAAVARIEHLRDRKRHESRVRRDSLLSLQRLALQQFDEQIAEKKPADARSVRDVLAWAAAPERSGRRASPWEPEAGPVWVAVLAVPLAWVVAAAVLRGGASMLLTGIAVVRADGRRAYRRQCAVRAAAVWLPVTGLLAGSVWLQVYHPRLAHSYTGLWLLAVALLPVYVVVALRYPTRPPQDRLAGTYLVPA